MANSHLPAHAPIIVFDFGGVLFNWKPAQLIQSVLPAHARNDAQALALAAEVFQSFTPGGDWSEFDRGALSWDEVAARIALRTGVPEADVQALMAAIPPHLAPMRETVDWLHALADDGVRLHFLSNMPRPFAEYLTREHAFLGRFISGVFSCDVGQIKPHADIFVTAAKRFDAQAHELVFIDDSIHNVHAALNQGWRAVQFLDAAQCRRELAERGWLPPR
ncbi:MAG: HAD family phosphatase [Aquabacterium sp.]